MLERKSTNPVFSGIQVGEYSDAATYAGVSAKLLLLLALASFSAFFAISNGGFNMTTLWISLFAAIVGVIGATMSRNLQAPFSILYALSEGYVLGFISVVYASAFGEGIVPAALLGTFSVFFVMVFLYATGIIRVGNWFRRFMFSALFGYFFFMLIVLLVGLWMPGFRETFFGFNSPIALWGSVALVIFAAFYILIDLDNVTYIVESGSSKNYEWRAALGVMVGLVWLYLRILRLLAVLASRAKD